MSKSKYSHNIHRTNGITEDVPYTRLKSEFDTEIILPLPQNLSSSMSADWQQESVSIAKSALMHNKDAINNMTMPESYKDILSAIPSSIGSMYNEAKEDVKSVLARTKSSSTIGGLKVVMNPRNEMLFQGMQFKNFSFVFLLVPYKEDDSATIQEAIRIIQKASAPEMKGAKMFMQYPETWFIEFYDGLNEGNEYLMKINECCCTGISINYTPQSDSSQMHYRNAPLAVELSLDFTEVFIPTKETLEKFNG